MLRQLQLIRRSKKLVLAYIVVSRRRTAFNHVTKHTRKWPRVHQEAYRINVLLIHEQSSVIDDSDLFRSTELITLSLIVIQEKIQSVWQCHCLWLSTFRCKNLGTPIHWRVNLHMVNCFIMFSIVVSLNHEHPSTQLTWLLYADMYHSNGGQNILLLLSMQYIIFVGI